jgi:hypothetical protein
VFKQVPLALVQQHLGKFNLQPPGNKHYSTEDILHENVV